MPLSSSLSVRRRCHRLLGRMAVLACALAAGLFEFIALQRGRWLLRRQGAGRARPC